VVLALRLNIYDGVDDVLDSYYIFVADFDDEEYFNDLFFSISPLLFFDGDVNDDRSLFLEDEFDLATDLFSLYFIM
jgi:extradiol dioxygenase family protein